MPQLDAKHPVILPTFHHVVSLIIHYYHYLFGHSGLEHVLSMVRESFWIVKGRAAVTKHPNLCFQCKRRQALMGEQKMANLPMGRITPDKLPFTYVSVKCFGPFFVHQGRNTAKRHGVLFTCLTVRAIHIEMVESLDADLFLHSMHRFITRRGMPEEVRSDNGGNFVRREKELQSAIGEWNQEAIAEFFVQQSMRWSFNPPSRFSLGCSLGTLYPHHLESDQCPPEGTSPYRWRTDYSHEWSGIYNQQ